MSANSNSRDLVTPLRLQLVANGYAPVPVNGKAVFLPDWRAAAARADEAECLRWRTTFTYESGDTVKTYRGDKHGNTGIACNGMACPDIDVPVLDLALRIEHAAIAMLGSTPLRRVGRSPKVLLAYRTTAPLPKMATPELFLLDGTKCQVEILGAGQQFVAYGIHPDTGREYEWTNNGPDVVPLAELPEAAERDLRDFVSVAERMMRAAGGRTQKEIDAASQEAAGGPDVPPRAETTSDRPKACSGPRSGAGGDSFFRNVNEAALGDLGAWVPRLFPKAKRQATGAWRISSADLGRDREEDLSIHPSGSRDFGEERACSPLDLVTDWGREPSVQKAAFQLCAWLGRDPATLGWKETRERSGPPPDQEQAEPEKQKPKRDADGEPWPEPVDFLDAAITGTPNCEKTIYPTRCIRSSPIPLRAWGQILPPSRCPPWPRWRASCRTTGLFSRNGTTTHGPRTRASGWPLSATLPS